MVKVLTYPSNVREVCKDKITFPSLNQNLARWKFWWVCLSEDHFGVLRETSAQFKIKISKLKFWATILYKDQWRVCIFRDEVSAQDCYLMFWTRKWRYPLSYICRFYFKSVLLQLLKKSVQRSPNLRVRALPRYIKL